MQINAHIYVCVCVCVCVYMHSGPVWMKCPGLIFCPSPALFYSLWFSVRNWSNAGAVQDIINKPSFTRQMTLD